MTDVTFITGNQNKADYLARFVGLDIRHYNMELIEIQSLDLRTVVRHKLLQAYAEIQRPVLVEDVALEFEALGRLPGTFIKFYIEEIPFETICRTVDGLSRNATAKSMYGYYDGTKMEFFEAGMPGTIAEHPRGEHGWGWDKIFIPNGYTQTRAELNAAEDEKTYMQIKPIDKLKAFLERT